MLKPLNLLSSSRTEQPVEQLYEHCYWFAAKLGFKRSKTMPNMTDGGPETVPANVNNFRQCRSALSVQHMLQVALKMDEAPLLQPWHAIRLCNAPLKLASTRPPQHPSNTP
jgi:hypothetical protein